jgi:hypothetical protein
MKGGTKMSNEINTRLFERASEMIDYWTGTMHAKLIQNSLDMNDLEQLEADVKRAESAWMKVEYEPGLDEVSDEQIELMGRQAWSGKVGDNDVF